MRMVKTSWTPELEDRPCHEIVPKLKWKWVNINVKLYYLSIYRWSGSLTLEIQPFQNRATMCSQELSPDLTFTINERHISMHLAEELV